MRSFIAIDLPEDIKEAINGLISKVSPGSSGIKWVTANNIHLTLKFLGEVKEELVPEIRKRLEDIGKLHRSFTIKIKGAGGFPNLKRPHVLWIGIEPSEGLQSLYRIIESQMSELGFERDPRSFSPHLTIGRVKDTGNMDSVAKGLSTYKDTFFGTIEVAEIRLKKSLLRQSGAEYSDVAVIKLK
jgi:RNA 2',3'-cyclic 3'-phosphodiesterase